MSGGILSLQTGLALLYKQYSLFENTNAEHGRYEQELNFLAALINDVMTVKVKIEILSLHSIMLNTLLKMQTESFPAGDFIYL
jgi:hypothetical protein